MGLKKIKENYENLIKVFDKVGIKLDESQKKSFDTFMGDIKNLISETQENTIKATSNVLAKEYKKVFESIMENLKQKHEKEMKISLKLNEMKETSKMANSVDAYLTEHLNEVLPKKVIVDYEKMAKLEKINESIKNLMGFDANELLKEKEEKINILENKLNESVDTTKQVNTKRIKEYISGKLSKMSINEAKEMKKLMNGMKLSEIDKNFEKLYESAKENAEKTEEQPVANIEDDQQEKNLEEAIGDILNEREENTKTSEENGETKEEETKETSEETNTEVSSEETETNTDTEDSESEELNESQVGVRITSAMMAKFIEEQGEGLFC